MAGQRGGKSPFAPLRTHLPLSNQTSLFTIYLEAKKFVISSRTKVQCISRHLAHFFATKNIIFLPDNPTDNWTENWWWWKLQNLFQIRFLYPLQQFRTQFLACHFISAIIECPSHFNHKKVPSINGVKPTKIIFHNFGTLRS